MTSLGFVTYDERQSRVTRAGESHMDAANAREVAASGGAAEELS